MILDKGICSVYEVANTAPPGEQPAEGLELLAEMWYGELDFETAPAFQTEDQTDIEISARIRVLQDRRINNKSIIKLAPHAATGHLYEVRRVYHGRDDDSGELISDISLAKAVSAYA
jgi:hypothetical protein